MNMVQEIPAGRFRALTGIAEFGYRAPVLAGILCQIVIRDGCTASIRFYNLLICAQKRSEARSLCVDASPLKLPHLQLWLISQHALPSAFFRRTVHDKVHHTIRDSLIFRCT